MVKISAEDGGLIPSPGTTKILTSILPQDGGTSCKVIAKKDFINWKFFAWYRT